MDFEEGSIAVALSFCEVKRSWRAEQLEVR